eukprot:CAMPEP_0180823964 /NCGR_PEP_ID=MMETSP1038_2-20121128/72186_1 /TAXON_ID=632150 /ORGANISM="Azadinium spinosum, Strain 3D9" /LENGTH=33 /DNA_ID= /DNA_START= /DNA_END= /DNA_ORIENTATION=
MQFGDALTCERCGAPRVVPENAKAEAKARAEAA